MMPAGSGASKPLRSSRTRSRRAGLDARPAARQFFGAPPEEPAGPPNSIIFGKDKSINYAEVSSGALAAAVAEGLAEFGQAGVQGVELASNLDNVLKYEKGAKRSKDPYFPLGVHVNGSLMLVLLDKKNPQFEAMELAVKGYDALKKQLAASSAKLVNISEDKGEGIIKRNAAAQADRAGAERHRPGGPDRQPGCADEARRQERQAQRDLGREGRSRGPAAQGGERPDRRAQPAGQDRERCGFGAKLKPDAFLTDPQTIDLGKKIASAGKQREEKEAKGPRRARRAREAPRRVRRKDEGIRGQRAGDEDRPPDGPLRGCAS
jgi:hypothetical protein